MAVKAGDKHFWCRKGGTYQQQGKAVTRTGKKGLKVTRYWYACSACGHRKSRKVKGYS